MFSCNKPQLKMFYFIILMFYPLLSRCRLFRGNIINLRVSPSIVEASFRTRLFIPSQVVRHLAPGELDWTGLDLHLTFLSSDWSWWTRTGLNLDSTGLRLDWTDLVLVLGLDLED